jgi:MraZ protein
MIPAKCREPLTAGMVLTKGQERCLYVFQSEEFERITIALRSSSISDKALRDYSRVFFAGASDEALDRQGRITIPHGLRSYAGLAGDCAVIGVNTRLEIWNLQNWKSYLSDRESPFSATADSIFPEIL